MATNKNMRTYMVVIDTTSEVPGGESLAVRVDAISRAEAENYGWRWARDHEIDVTEITVYLK